MNREDFDKLNKFLKDNGIKKVELVYAGWQALQEQLNHNKIKQEEMQWKENIVFRAIRAANNLLE